MALEVTPRLAGDTAILDMTGRLWVLDLPLHSQVQSMLAQGVRFFIFNLADVDYIDSSGLGQLISIWTSVRTKNGNVNLLKPTPRVRHLLTTTRLQVIFDVFEDEEKARLAVRRDWPA